MLIVLGLGDADGGIEIVVGQRGTQDLVAVVLQIGRFQAAVQSVTTFCTSLYEFSFFSFDSRVAVVIIE